ncbi:MAG: LysM peptidoglycan-binding domain-containing protein [Clostridiales bacterium]|nr:LysM peptidoglycan-binding domain-containing protein [Clostridiales bacterium]
MEIYIVKNGDTIESIADNFGLPVEKIVLDNELTDPSRLVPGEMIVIVYPSQTHTVLEGESLGSIAALYGISISELLRNNPILSDMEFIYPGQELTISYDRTQSIETFGYANAFINRQLLAKTLPYLTYLSVFNYQLSSTGEVIENGPDSDIVEMSTSYGVVPLMHLSAITVQGELDIETTFNVLTNEALQDIIIDNVMNILQSKGYMGVVLSAQYIDTQNQYLFANYAQNFSDRLDPEGYYTFITIDPNVSSTDGTVTYEDLNYTAISSPVDAVLALEYRWGFDIIPPGPFLSIDEQDVLLDHVITQMPAEKVVVGVPIFGYRFELPYVDGFSRNDFLTRSNIINLARDYGATIEFDESSQNSYYYYEEADTLVTTQYIVWFINAITIDSLLDLMLEKGINKISIWNIMSYFTQLWLILNSQYEIIKLLPEF